jgi:hypothetical protein
MPGIYSPEHRRTRSRGSDEIGAVIGGDDARCDRRRTGRPKVISP